MATFVSPQRETALIPVMVASILSLSILSPNAAAADRRDDAEDQLRATLSALPCSDVAFEPVDGDRYQVSGYVSAPDHLDIVWKAFDAHELTAKGKVSVRPWPVCEALQILKPYANDDDTLSVASNNADGSYLSGDQLSLEIRVPAGSRHLYVIYLQASGDAVWLYASPLDGEPDLDDRPVVLGDGPDQPRFEVAPPFGEEVIVTLASSAPLFDRGATLAADDRAFLETLRQVLDQQPPSADLAAGWLAINTAPK